MIMTMSVSQITSVLTAMGIDHFVDSCNPDFTIHISSTGDLIDRCLQESDWEFISLDRKCFVDVLNEDELKAILLKREVK
jgi:hypothetical protein